MGLQLIGVVAPFFEKEMSVLVIGGHDVGEFDNGILKRDFVSLRVFPSHCIYFLSNWMTTSVGRQCVWSCNWCCGSFYEKEMSVLVTSGHDVGTR